MRGKKKILGCDELGLSGASKSPLFLFYCPLGSLFFQQLGIVPLPAQSLWSLATVTGYVHHLMSSLCYPGSPSLWCKQPLPAGWPSHSHQDATDLPMETLHVLHCQWPGSCSHGTGPLICLQLSTPCSSCSPLPYSADSWWRFPCPPSSDRSSWVIDMSPWSLLCLSAMSPWFHSSIALRFHCHVTRPQNSVMPISHCHGTLLHCYASHQQPSETPFACTLPGIPFTVYSAIHYALTWNPPGSKHHAPYDSHTLNIHEKKGTVNSLNAGDPEYNSSRENKKIQRPAAAKLGSSLCMGEPWSRQRCWEEW